MGLGSFVKKTIKTVGTVTKVGIEIGTEAIGAIAEKIDDNPKSKDNIVTYGKQLGQNIKKSTNELAENSVDVVDRAVETSIKTYKSINEGISINISNTMKKYSENKKSKQIQDNKYVYSDSFNDVEIEDQSEDKSKDKSKDVTEDNNKYKYEENKKTKSTEYNNEYIPENIYTKIVGVTFDNRQLIVEKLKVGDIVKLEREYNNKYDNYAIAIYNVNSEMLGYIPKYDNRSLAKAMDNLIVYKAIVISKNGGNVLSYGANIQVTKLDFKSYKNNKENGNSEGSKEARKAKENKESKYSKTDSENKSNFESKPKVINMYHYISESRMDSNNTTNKKCEDKLNDIKTKSESTKVTENNEEYIPENIFTKIIGVTIEDRQFVVGKLKVGDMVKLIRESNNKYDKYAIAIYNTNSDMLGYVPKDDSKNLSKAMDKGFMYEAIVTSKNGGSGLSYGANVHIIKVNPNESKKGKNEENVICAESEMGIDEGDIIY